ncbi:MAG: hypothetical protein EBE86_006940 [Hormoscilla sp. GUM202]|nr:hypothetical protein [Hormoscilla sp. GUM202]
MVIMLNNLEIIEWLWHDADLHLLTTAWSDSGETSVSLRCEINPEELREPLFELGIKTSLVDVHFCPVWHLKTDLIGYIAGREVVLNWHVSDRTPAIELLRGNGAARNVELFHHQIKGSGGPTIEIVCEMICLEEVKPQKYP